MQSDCMFQVTLIVLTNVTALECLKLQRIKLYEGNRPSGIILLIFELMTPQSLPLTNRPVANLVNTLQS